METSIFTKIINGEIPSHKIYEDSQIYAFLDIFPVQPGHVLVVPKVQVPFVWDLDQDTYTALMAAVQKVAVRQRQVMAVPYVSARVVNVDVPHAHVHLIPFSAADQLNNKPDMATDPDHEALSAIAQKLAF